MFDLALKVLEQMSSLSMTRPLCSIWFPRSGRLSRAVLSYSIFVLDVSCFARSIKLFTILDATHEKLLDSFVGAVLLQGVCGFEPQADFTLSCIQAEMGNQVELFRVACSSAVWGPEWTRNIFLETFGFLCWF